jgi:hypothetical protein
MRVGVVYTGRLGDIVGTLPLSYDLSRQGHAVFHYAASGFEDIFRAVSYVKPRVVEGDVHGAYPCALALARKECDLVYDRQISPRLKLAYRRSDLTWAQFYYGQDYPHLVGVPPVFDVTVSVRKLPPRTLLLAMHGISSPFSVHWLWVKEVCERLRDRGLIEHVVYTCREGETGPSWCETDHTPAGALPSLMRGARAAFFRNSAPAWIAYGVGIPTLHLPDSKHPEQDTAGPAPHLIPLRHCALPDEAEAAITRLAAVPWDGGRA